MGIQGYTILQGNSMVSLEQKVKDAIGNGWVPQGGVCVESAMDIHQWTAPWYYQAMIFKVPKVLDN